MPKIKFSKCPIEPHKGEYWEKLKGFKTGDKIILKQVSVTRSSDVTPEEIKIDTFRDFSVSEWYDLFEAFYGLPDVVLIRLYFETPDNHPYPRYLTTFRSYDTRKMLYYYKAKGKEFVVVLT